MILAKSQIRRLMQPVFRRVRKALFLWKVEASETLPRAGVINRTTTRGSAESGLNPQAGRPFPPGVRRQ
jgi:hypothetical protein